jgi:hypothetical protein
MDIPRKFLGIDLLFHQNGLESSLKQVPGALPLDIEISCIGPIDMMKNFGKITARGL